MGFIISWLCQNSTHRIHRIYSPTTFGDFQNLDQEHQISKENQNGVDVFHREAEMQGLVVLQ